MERAKLKINNRTKKKEKREIRISIDEFLKMPAIVIVLHDHGKYFDVLQ